MPLSIPPYLGGTSARWPNASDVSAYAATLGLPAIPAPDAERVAAAARQRFLSDTGWPVFLSDGQTVVEEYQVPLASSRGFLVDIGAWRSVASVSAEGSPIPSGDYMLDRRRPNAPDTADYPNPYVRLRLWDGRRTVEIEGVRGVCAQIPHDVFVAVIRLAVSLYASDVAAGRVSSVRQGDVQYTYASDLASLMVRDYTFAAERWMR